MYLFVEVEDIVFANSIHWLLGRHPLVAASGRAKDPLVNRGRQSEQVQNTGLHCVERISLHTSPNDAMLSLPYEYHKPNQALALDRQALIAIIFVAVAS